MTDPATLPPEARAAILAALPDVTVHGAMLPDPVPLDRVLSLFDGAQRTREERLQVQAGHDEQGYFLDYYRIDNDGETSSHGRIRTDGSVQALENLEGQFGFRVFPDPADTERERKRIGEHNTRVHEILRAKGFRW